MDEGSFQEIGMLVSHRSIDFGMEKEKYPGDGVVTGYGTINGRLPMFSRRILLFLAAHFPKPMPKRSVRLWIWPIKNGAPFVGSTILAAPASRKAWYPWRLRRYLLPQYHGIRCYPANFGYYGAMCAGGAVYSPAITDFILMVEHTSYMFVTGPNVVKTVTHEVVTSEELGGAIPMPPNRALRILPVPTK
jgi:propionyl-CoA carboxylase beta chain